MPRWEDGPEECELSKWEAEVEEEYLEFIEKNCICEVCEDCECITLDQFIERKLEDMHDRWNFRDIEESEPNYA